MSWLKATAVRSIQEATVELGPRFTLVTGPNGAGKTNLLEAVHLAATLRPLTTSTPAEVVRSGSERASVEARITGSVLPLDVRVVIQGGRRRAFVAGKPLTDPSAYLGTLATVSFTPDDMRLVKAGPEGRRHFLSRAAVELWPAAREELRRLERALRQRNAALRRGVSNDVLRAMEEPLIRSAVAVWRRRERAVQVVVPHARRWVANLLDGRCLGMAFQPSVPNPTVADFLGMDDEARVQVFSKVLQDSTEEDRRKGATTYGPHHDDVELAVDDLAARRFLSQGQQRCVALALTLGVVDAVREARARPPLCLLDDVSSELDENRRAALFTALGEAGSQVVATATDPSLLPVPQEARAEGDLVHYEAQNGTFVRHA